ncbi:hypothetical protein EV401DRAFT_913250 [Pisolithus croceorrhizus]|nr:hypothetical protein EV401DRAFT_913250 [Pisolithus croceorrhizus]
MLSVLAATGVGMAAAILEFLKSETRLSMQISYHIGIPTLAIYMLSGILITMSLCSLLHDNGTRSAFPRMMRLLNTLIIYAVNSCFLMSLITIRELVTVRIPYCKATTFTLSLSQFRQDVSHLEAWTIALDFIVYPNSLLASLNARQYLRTEASSTVSDPRISAVDFAKRSKLHEHAEGSDEGTG